MRSHDAALGYAAVTTALHIGDCRAILATLPAASVHCVVTSPPYWGLRDYGTATWEGGDPRCDHVAPNGQGQTGQRANRTFTANAPFKVDCGKCGAIRIDAQLGLEPDFNAYVANMVAVFREVRRVLRDDGTLWLNLGDSYATQGGRGEARMVELGQPSIGALTPADARGSASGTKMAGGLKPKDLCGIPWRVAFALQQPYYTGRIKDERDRIWLAAMIDAEGCMFIHSRKEGQSNGQGYVRQNATYGAGLEIANTHETVIQRCLQITGQGSSFRHDKDRRQPLWRWNMRSNECREIIREIYPYLVAKQHQARLLLGCPSSGEKATAAHQGLIDLHNGKSIDLDFPPPASMYEPGWYLRQDIVWSKPNPMPESVTDRCTKAHEYLFLLSKRERYYYDAEAIREEGEGYGRSEWNAMQFKGGDITRNHGGKGNHGKGGGVPTYAGGRNKRSVWEVTTAPFAEAHFATFPPALIEPCIKAGCPRDGTVLDPFAGAGTTGLVADRLQRNAVLIELNPAYAAMGERRIVGDAPLFAEVAQP